METLYKKVIQHAEHCHQIAEKNSNSLSQHPALDLIFEDRRQAWQISTHGRYASTPFCWPKMKQNFSEVIPMNSATSSSIKFSVALDLTAENGKTSCVAFLKSSQKLAITTIRHLSGQSFRYQCSCQTFELTIRRHNKVQRKQATYQCQTCHQPLVWLGE